MGFSRVAKVDTIRSIANGSITSSFAVLGSALTHACRMFRIINNCDQDMFFSLDGSNNQFFVPKSSFVLYDLAAGAGSPNASAPFVLQIGTQFYIKYASAPSSGSVYIEVIYAQGE